MSSTKAAADADAASPPTRRGVVRALFDDGTVDAGASPSGESPSRVPVANARAVGSASVLSIHIPDDQYDTYASGNDECAPSTSSAQEAGTQLYQQLWQAIDDVSRSAELSSGGRRRRGGSPAAFDVRGSTSALPAVQAALEQSVGLALFGYGDDDPVEEQDLVVDNAPQQAAQEAAQSGTSSCSSPPAVGHQQPAAAEPLQPVSPKPPAATQQPLDSVSERQSPASPPPTDAASTHLEDPLVARSYPEADSIHSPAAALDRPFRSSPSVSIASELELSPSPPLSPTPTPPSPPPATAEGAAHQQPVAANLEQGNVDASASTYTGSHSSLNSPDGSSTGAAASQPAQPINDDFAELGTFAQFPEIEVAQSAELSFSSSSSRRRGRRPASAVDNSLQSGSVSYGSASAGGAVSGVHHHQQQQRHLVSGSDDAWPAEGSADRSVPSNLGTCGSSAASQGADPFPGSSSPERLFSVEVGVDESVSVVLGESAADLSRVVHTAHGELLSTAAAEFDASRAGGTLASADPANGGTPSALAEGCRAWGPEIVMASAEWDAAGTVNVDASMDWRPDSSPFLAQTASPGSSFDGDGLRLSMLLRLSSDPARPLDLGLQLDSMQAQEAASSPLGAAAAAAVGDSVPCSTGDSPERDFRTSAEIQAEAMVEEDEALAPASPALPPPTADTGHPPVESPQAASAYSQASGDSPADAGHPGRAHAQDAAQQLLRLSRGDLRATDASMSLPSSSMGSLGLAELLSNVQHVLASADATFGDEADAACEDGEADVLAASVEIHEEGGLEAAAASAVAEQGSQAAGRQEASRAPAMEQQTEDACGNIASPQQQPPNVSSSAGGIGSHDNAIESAIDGSADLSYGDPAHQQQQQIESPAVSDTRQAAKDSDTGPPECEGVSEDLASECTTAPQSDPAQREAGGDAPHESEHCAGSPLAPSNTSQAQEAAAAPPQSTDRAPTSTDASVGMGEDSTASFPDAAGASAPVEAPAPSTSAAALSGGSSLGFSATSLASSTSSTQSRRLQAASALTELKAMLQPAAEDSDEDDPVSTAMKGQIAGCLHKMKLLGMLD